VSDDRSAGKSFPRLPSPVIINQPGDNAASWWVRPASAKPRQIFHQVFPSPQTPPPPPPLRPIFFSFACRPPRAPRARPPGFVPPSFSSPSRPPVFSPRPTNQSGNEQPVEAKLGQTLGQDRRVCTTATGPPPSPSGLRPPNMGEAKHKQLGPWPPPLFLLWPPGGPGQ